VVTLDPATATEPERVEFFVSYTKADERWAAWIAWQLEDAVTRICVLTT
jgi:hypothetical protein